MSGTGERISGRSIELTQVTEWQDGRILRVEDQLAAEEPLEIRVNGEPVSVTMRTPGHDLELAAGFLLTEGLVESWVDITSMVERVSATTDKGNLVEVEISGLGFDMASQRRNFFAASSCGICGKASIEAIRRRGLRVLNSGFRVQPEVLCGLPERLRQEQAIFGRTGGLHAAGLFTAHGELLVLREDIGRHNAVDKVAGWALRNGLLPLADTVLLVSGRGGFEIVQKAIAIGIPVLASVSAPSGLAVRLARELGQTLIGFLRGRRFVVYAGDSRCIADESTRVSPGRSFPIEDPKL